MSADGILSLDQIRRLRFRAQGLYQPLAADVASIVAAAGALQAQDLPAAVLGVRARSVDLISDDVQHAREVERCIMLTWCMRGTLHLVATADLRWMGPLFGSANIQASARRYRQLGLDEAIRERATDLIANTLQMRGPLTRAELADMLATHHIPVEGQAIFYLLRHAALRDVICFGPQRDTDLTFVLRAEWVNAGDPLDEEQARAALARRYIAAYGPASRHDLAKWSGLGVIDARQGMRALADELIEFEYELAPVWMLKDQAQWLDELPGDPVVRLLPMYDGYLLGHQHRDFLVNPQYAHQIHPGGGVIRASLVVNGEVRGIWLLRRRQTKATLTVEPFVPLNAALRAAVEAEAHDVGRFLGLTVDIVIGRN